CNALALENSFALVECPVDAEVDSALGVFLFSFRKRIKAGGLKRAPDAVGALCYTIVLIRDKRELNVVFPQKFPQNLKKGAAKTGMAGGIRGERRREVGSV